MPPLPPLPPVSILLLPAFVLGACVGSFLNVCIMRVPRGESVVRPRSFCRSCRNPLGWRDTVPLWSWIVRRGRCRTCDARFSVRYFAVELLTAAAAVLLVARFGVGWLGLSHFVFFCLLLVVSCIDLDHYLIPDVFSLPGVLLGLGFAALTQAPIVWDAALGATLGGGLLWAVARGYRGLTGRDGMGGGDVKLLAMIGAFLGWRGVPVALFVAAVAGSVVGLVAMARQGADLRLKAAADKYGLAQLVTMARQGAGLRLVLPFGPFLALGALVSLAAGEALIAWYVGVIRGF